MEEMARKKRPKKESVLGKNEENIEEISTP